MKRLKKIIKIFIIAVFMMTISAVLYHYCVRYDNERAAAFITKYSFNKSHNYCAGWVMAAIIAGGEPCILLRACDYKYFLPYIGFEEIKLEGYKHQVGDIVVFPNIGKHKFGHIAMWNGKQWVSDFKQKNFIVAKDYIGLEYKIYRHKDGSK